MRLDTWQWQRFEKGVLSACWRAVCLRGMDTCSLTLTPYLPYSFPTLALLALQWNVKGLTWVVLTASFCTCGLKFVQDVPFFVLFSLG